MNIGKQIKALRIRRGVTQEAMAQRLGVSPQAVSKWERGAKAWCRMHKDDYRDVPTYIVSYDTIHDPKFLMVNELDLNGTVRADPALCGLFLKAAEAAEVPCKKGWVPPLGGATDSAAFTRGGFRSVGVTGLNRKLEDHCRISRDTCDSLNAERLENCDRATVRYILIFPQEPPIIRLT